MRPRFNANQLFDLYVQTVKSCDKDFNNSISKGGILKEGSDQVLSDMAIGENIKENHNFI